MGERCHQPPRGISGSALRVCALPSAPSPLSTLAEQARLAPFFGCWL
ncbi:hypothetical protein CGRA01v4_02488 [Colletotrichum graminicola]|nr:hypothetical protein CGRA01v4_02488 [Colletotrichum graminicola]